MKRYIIAIGLILVLVPLRPEGKGHIKNSIVVAEAKAVTTPSPHLPTPIEPEQPKAESKPAEVIDLTDHEKLMQQAGIDQNEWAAVDYIISHESGWCHLQWEGQIGFCPESYTEQYDPSTPNIGYGFCQSTPAIKMASIENDWQTNPITQLKWCNEYAHSSRYGNWWIAYNFWVANHHW